MSKITAAAHASAIWPLTFNRFGKAKLNKGKSVRRDKLVDELTIHGLPLSLKASTWAARLLWAALFITMFSMLVQELVIIYSSISTTPTAINLQQDTRSELELPEITICSTQSFNVTKLFSDGISLNIGDFVGTEADITMNVTDEQADTIELKRTQIFRRVNSWKEFLDIYGVQCRHFFVKCQVNGADMDCCDYFKTMYSMQEGVCFRYIGQRSPPDSNLVQTEPGINGSLQILLQTPAMSPYWSGGPKWNGLTIGLPYLWDPFVTSTGEFVLIRLTGEKNVRDVTTACREPESWMNRDAGCPQTQWDAAVQEICNCSLYATAANNRILCDPFTFRLCQRDLDVDTKMLYNELVKEKCALRLCEEWVFQVSLSYAEINRAWVRSAIGEVDTTLQYTLLNFYYPSLAYDEIHEFQQVTLENVISQFGGLMAVWIGASMISLIQLGVYALQYLLDKFMDWIQVKDIDSEF